MLVTVCVMVRYSHKCRGTLSNILALPCTPQPGPVAAGDLRDGSCCSEVELNAGYGQSATSSPLPSLSTGVVDACRFDSVVRFVWQWS